MTITEMRSVYRRADGSTLERDSTNPEHAKEIEDYLNVPVVVVRVDSRGQIVEVKERGGLGGAVESEGGATELPGREDEV